MAILNPRTTGAPVPQVEARRPLTSAVSSVGSTPVISQRTASTPTSLTSSGSGAPHQSLTSTTAPSSGNNNALIAALVGAAAGVGGNYLYDKLTGLPKNQSPPSAPVIPKAPVKKPSVPGLPSDSGIYHYPTNPSGGSPYDDEGNLMPGWQLNEENDPVWVGYDTPTDAPIDMGQEPSAATGEFLQDSSGNVYQLMPDGTYALHTAAEIYDTDPVIEQTHEGTVNDLSGSDSFDYYDPDLDSQTSIGDYVDPNYDSYDYGGYYDFKDGGLTTMNQNYNIPKFEGGGYVAYDDDGYLMPGFQLDENNDPVYVGFDSTQTAYNPAPNSTLTDFMNNLIGGGKSVLGGIGGALNTPVGAGAAGALVGSLLGQNFSGGSGLQNKGVDMSKVGVINPRTTNFGIGPAKFVGHQDYGTSGGAYTPNDELLHNLNAPGYNEVSPGDYAKATPKMASGGLSSMATPVASYYTFGQPADILANLGMRPQPPENPPEQMAQIGQQQPTGSPQEPPAPQMQGQMPDQMAQGQMPQGLPQPMRSGGLPHASNVPIVQGRMDFRQGAAVHGEGDGQSDDIPAMLADGEYVIDSETVAQIGNGSTKAGAQALDKFREGIRAHKRSAPINKIPPKTKPLTSYLKGAK